MCMFINQDPVLNQTVSLLAQSMRETEDELIRNMLASTASVINCTGGVNGRNVAVVKSSLMDLKTLTHESEGNKAQAEQYALAA